MRRKQMRRNELPDTCLSTLPSTGQLVVLKHGVRGYYRSEWDTGNRAENRDIADSHNRRRGITDIQETAMMAGSMFGWDTPGAEPQWYLDNARYRNATTAKGHIKDPVMSIYYPVDDFLLRYEVMGKEKLYAGIGASEGAAGRKVTVCHAAGSGLRCTRHAGEGAAGTERQLHHGVGKRQLCHW